MERAQGIHETIEAANGRNEHGRSLNIPSDHVQGLLWLVQRITKLTNERKTTAQKIKDVKAAAKNDGYTNEELSAIKKLNRMSPEARERYREKMRKVWQRYGLSIEVADEDPKHDQLLESHLSKLWVLENDRRDASREILDTYKAAAGSGYDVPALKQILRMSHMTEDDRENYFAALDSYGAKLNYWSA